MVKINITNGSLSNEEAAVYIKMGRKKYPKRLITSVDIEVDGDFVNVQYHFQDVPFQRIRRITGYLVGTIDKFNDAKKAEVNDRLKHTV